MTPHTVAVVRDRDGRWAFIGAALGAVIALACFAPATWVAQAVDRWSAGRLQLTEVRGTVWSASARLVLTGGRGSAERSSLPTRVDWTLRPTLQGLALSISSGCCIRDAMRVDLSWSGSGWQLNLDHLSSDWPAELLQGLGAPWNTIGLTGRLHVKGQGLRVTLGSGPVRVSGGATLDATDMSSSLVPIRPVGSYRLDLRGGEVPRLRLATMGGPLSLVGEGTLVNGRLGFSGVARADGPDAIAFESLLGIVGRRVGPRAEFRLG